MQYTYPQDCTTKEDRKKFRRQQRALHKGKDPAKPKSPKGLKKQKDAPVSTGVEYIPPQLTDHLPQEPTFTNPPDQIFTPEEFPLLRATSGFGPEDH